MTALFEFVAAVRGSTRESFLQGYTTPLLLASSEGRTQDQTRAFKTTSISGSAVDLVRAVATGAVSLSAKVDKLEVLAIAKSKDSPWAGRVTLGRTRTNDVVIDDPSVSKTHAHFEQKGDRWAVTDAQSHNGVRLNGALLAPGEPHPLTLGDTLLFGTVAATWLDAGSLYDFIRSDMFAEK